MFKTKVNNNIRNQFNAYDFDKPVTVKQDQGHQTWYALVGPKQYNNALFEKKKVT